MSRPSDRLREWLGPRKRSVVGGLAPLLVGLLVFGFVTHDWLLTTGGFIGLLLFVSGVAMFVINPALWEPERRWKALGLWVLVVTAAIVLAVIVVFLST